MKNSIARWSLFIILLAAPFGTYASGPPSTPGRPALIGQLVGHWRMVGDVGGKAVAYRLRSQLTLDGKFLELHMQDVNHPPRYEARVFIGYDSKSQQVIAHWLDSFGAASSIPHGTGHIDGNVLQFEIPYKNGPFRDTIVYKPLDGTWTLAIEASDGKNGWKHFAAYQVSRSPDTVRPAP